MRQLLAVAMVVGIGAWSPVPGAEAHDGAAQKKCGVKGSKVEAMTGRVRVVRKRWSSGEDWYACVRVQPYYDSRHARRHGYRKRRLLGRVDCGEGCGTAVAVSGPASPGDQSAKVAFAEGSCIRYWPSPCHGTVVVVAMESGRRASTTATDADFPELDITPGGTAVWIDELEEGHAGTPTYEEHDAVRGLTLSGETLQFDEGPELSELALAGNTVYWKRAGEVQSAQVP